MISMNSDYKGAVLITVDSLRADHMSCYGYERKTTPFLDDFASKSFFFKNATSAGPRTASSFPCMLSSSYLSSHPYGHSREGRLSKERLMISEYLKDKVKTAAFHSNPVISSYYGYDRGFDKFEDFIITDSTIDAGPIRRLKRIIELLLGKPPFTPGDKINDECLKWVDSTDDKFFLWTHYMEPHMPYLPPSSYLRKIGAEKVGHLKKLLLGKRLDNVNQRENLISNEVYTLMDLYDACIRYFDDIMKDFIDRLPDNVAVIFTADHGEGFNEHGFLGHQDYLYDEIVHIPMIVSTDNKKGDIDTPVGHIDIVPTILSLLGIKISKKYEGKNLLNVPDRDGMFTESKSGDDWQTSYRGKDFKYILDGKRKKEEFYDLNEDPMEKNNLADNTDLDKYRKRVLNHREEQKSKRSQKEKDMVNEKIKGLNL